MVWNITWPRYRAICGSHFCSATVIFHEIKLQKYAKSGPTRTKLLRRHKIPFSSLHFTPSRRTHKLQREKRKTKFVTGVRMSEFGKRLSAKKFSKSAKCETSHFESSGTEARGPKRRSARLIARCPVFFFLAYNKIFIVAESRGGRGPSRHCIYREWCMARELVRIETCYRRDLNPVPVPPRR